MENYHHHHQNNKDVLKQLQAQDASYPLARHHQQQLTVTGQTISQMKRKLGTNVGGR